MTSRERAKALAEDIVRQWFSRSLGSMNGWEKWQPIWTDQLTEQFHKALAAPALGWTKERPKVAGYYWWRTPYNDGAFIERVFRVIEYAGELYVPDMGYVEDIVMGEWAGPIIPPLEVPT